MVDAVALFPFDWAISVYAAQQDCNEPACVDARNTARSTRLMRLTKISRMARLTKLAKLTRLRSMGKSILQFLKNIGMTELGVEFALRVAGLCFLLVACAHLIACLWLHVGIASIVDQDALGLDDSGAQLGKNWMLQEYGTLSNALAVGQRRYIDATYWVFVTVSSVGFGDILPISTSEREFTCATIVFGSFLYAYIIGTFTNMISNMGQDKSTFDAKMRSITELMKFLAVPSDLEDKVHAYYEYKFANNTMFTAGLVDELPVRLRADLVLHRFQAVIDKVPIPLNMYCSPLCVALCVYVMHICWAEQVPFFHGLREDAVVDICTQLKSHAIMPV